MTDPIRRGAIYSVPDTSVTFPPRALKDRQIKPSRPFLVASSDTTNDDENWPIVLGFPLSTSPHFRSEFDVDLTVGNGGLKEDCWVQVVMIQPLAKTKLNRRIGHLLANDVERVMTNLARYTGLI